MDFANIALQIYILTKPHKIIEAHNCMTRLRINIGDTNNLPMQKLKQIDGVLGVNLSGSELQIVLGPAKVNKVAAEFQKLLVSQKTGEEVKEIAKPSPDKKVVEIGQAEKLHKQIRQKKCYAI